MDLLVHEGFGGVLIVKVVVILDRVRNSDGHFLEFIADGAN